MRRFHLILPAVRAVLALAALIAPSAVAAHPHVWVTVETEVVYNEQKAITGFRHKWTFDEGYSRFAVEGRDLNRDGNYDREELAELAEVNISSLKEFDFFTFPKLGGTLLPREEPKDYWLEYHDGLLTLYLTLPLTTPLAADKIKNFSFAVYDPTFYVDFALAEKDPIRLSAAPPGCAPVIKEPHPDAAQRGAQTLSQAFSGNPDAEAASIAEQYARSVHIVCPAG
ncbi:MULTISPECIES: DUF1007 family protein [Rhodomicrobium]|uniref:DUF1007 family protein n=1 Tax=Rhodomicrobium TaxID=1068 RepID=UPI000B4AEBC6|nr:MULTISPECIES: DUF1007 family protein [Rhodomicrobium]